MYCNEEVCNASIGVVEAHIEGALEAVLGAQHKGAQQAEEDEDDDGGADGAHKPGHHD